MTDHAPHSPASVRDLTYARGRGYCYLASPYTSFPGGYEAAYRTVCRAASYLIGLGVPTFSPITHSHPIATIGEHVDHADHDAWLRVDEPLVRNADSLVILREPGVADSYGISVELGWAAEEGLPVFDLWPWSYQTGQQEASAYHLTRR